MIAKWIIVGWIALGALLTVGFVGKERKPMTPAAASIATALSAAVIVTIVIWWRA